MRIYLYCIFNVCKLPLNCIIFVLFSILKIYSFQVFSSKHYHFILIFPIEDTICDVFEIIPSFKHFIFAKLIYLSENLNPLCVTPTILSTDFKNLFLLHSSFNQNSIIFFSYIFYYSTFALTKLNLYTHFQ